MKRSEKNISNDFVCGHPLPSGGRCAEPVVWSHPCPVHRSLTFEEHPLPSQKCVCERPLVEIPEDQMEAPRCFRCGHELPEQRGDQMAGRLVSDGGGGVRRRNSPLTESADGQPDGLVQLELFA